MNNLSDGIAYLAKDPVRVEVALACREGPRTKAEIARYLGREPGSLSAPKTLEKKGVLRTVGEVSSEKPSRGGVRWELKPEWDEAVDRAADHVWRGRLTEGIDLILIRAIDVAEACRVLLSETLEVSWAIPLQGEQMGLLICPSVLPNERGLLNALDCLRTANPIRLRLPVILSGAGLLNWAREIDGGGARPERLSEGGGPRREPQL